MLGVQQAVKPLYCGTMLRHTIRVKPLPTFGMVFTFTQLLTTLVVRLRFNDPLIPLLLMHLDILLQRHAHHSSMLGLQKERSMLEDNTFPISLFSKDTLGIFVSCFMDNWGSLPYISEFLKSCWLIFHTENVEER
jgi:hypothetical protein